MKKTGKRQRTTPVPDHSRSDPVPFDPTAGPLAERRFPDVAAALRARIKGILIEWETQVRRHLPPVEGISFDEVLDSLPEILDGIAGAIGSGDSVEINRLMDRSPSQGIHRYQIHYDARQLATEDRMLRRLIIENVNREMGRRLSLEEEVALNWAIDLMAQQAMVAFVAFQNQQLRAAAEAELKFLSFLSHDLNGNLGNVTLWLQILRDDLKESGGFTEQVSAVDSALDAIFNTTSGMRQLLQAEQLRHDETERRPEPVNLHELCGNVVVPFEQQIRSKGLGLALDVPEDASVSSDAELIRLVLQNLISNAIKYSSRGTVRITAQHGEGTAQGGWAIAVSDEGPGIPAERVNSLFEVFRRGETHGQSGVGLGLAIATRAASLLKAKLAVDSEVGKGSTFRLVFLPLTSAGNISERLSAAENQSSDRR